MNNFPFLLLKVVGDGRRESEGGRSMLLPFPSFPGNHGW